MEISSLKQIDIFEDIWTEEKRQTSLMELEIILSSIFQKKPLILLAKKLRTETFNRIKSSISEAAKNEKSLGEFCQNLEALKKKIENLESIRLTLAIEPTEELISKIFLWVQKNLGKELIINVKTDKTILGGAILVFKGYYQDLSLRRSLEKHSYYQNN